VRTRLLRKGTVRGKNITKTRRKILPRTIRTKNFDTFPKLRKNHLRKLTINGQNIRTMTQKIKPGITRKIINKAHIIRKPAKRGHRGTQMSECTKSKDATDTDSLEGKGRARCFANLQPIQTDKGLKDTDPRTPELESSFRRAVDK